MPDTTREMACGKVDLVIHSVIPASNTFDLIINQTASIIHPRLRPLAVMSVTPRQRWPGRADDLGRRSGMLCWPLTAAMPESPGLLAPHMQLVFYPDDPIPKHLHLLTTNIIFLFQNREGQVKRCRSRLQAQYILLLSWQPGPVLISC